MLGICGVGGYTLNTAKSEKRVKAVATMSMFNTGCVRREGYTSTQIGNDLYREGIKYYGKTHRHPNSTFEYTRYSLTELMTWDVTDNLKLINVPTLMMAGSAADSLYLTEDAIEKATGTRYKELFLIPGAFHIQTYYVPEHAEQEEVSKLSEFFGRTL